MHFIWSYHIVCCDFMNFKFDSYINYALCLFIYDLTWCFWFFFSLSIINFLLACSNRLRAILTARPFSHTLFLYSFIGNCRSRKCCMTIHVRNINIYSVLCTVRVHILNCLYSTLYGKLVNVDSVYMAMCYTIMV